jgi:hypothetical protein
VRILTKSDLAEVDHSEERAQGGREGCRGEVVLTLTKSDLAKLDCSEERVQGEVRVETRGGRRGAGGGGRRRAADAQRRQTKMMSYPINAPGAPVQ